MQLQDKVVVITGAARGLGRAYAEAAAAAGAAVMACDINSCAETVAAVRAAGGRIEQAETDISNMSSCESMVEQALAAFGKIDVLVNNAALYATLNRARFEDLDEAQWDAVMNVNVKGVWQTCKAVVKPMRATGGGSIINIASLAAVYGMTNGCDYAASKAAVIGMTRAMARELGKDNIRVNAVAPSLVMTEASGEFYGDVLDKAATAIAGNQMIKRNLQPADLAGTILYLASDASAFVTGQTHMVDGGSWLL